ncbi:MAG: 5-methyltetrahydrofolate--homocysteine methyltransferase [Bacteroidaceae bacterium]|nr:5-methyltetrahydrofolate--homocysteine methyltransferase [Bacteroidaceae bacterium]
MAQTIHYSIHEVVPYINWSYFFHAWGFAARFATIAQIHGCDSCRAQWLTSFPASERSRAAEAMQLHKEASRFLFELEAQHFRVHFRFDLFPCFSQDEDILLQPQPGTPPVRLSFLRQQTSPYLCLSDFIRPFSATAAPDRIGLFCSAADAGIEQLYADGRADADVYRHLLCQTLADRLAEAATERGHQAVRRSYWGYVPAESLSVSDLFAERFQGIRPAVGYPCLPDQSLNFDLHELLDFSAIGIQLTENGAMTPHASTSGLMIAHPEARYFAVGRIDEDQLQNYAQRKGRTPEELRPFLGSNLM